MNFKKIPGKAPPTIKQRTIRVHKRTSGPTINTNFSSKPRSIMESQNRVTPRSITKATSSPPVLTNNVLRDEFLDRYLEGTHDSLSHKAVEAREQGVSLQDVERFDLTSLYGARKDAVERLHARNVPPGSQYHFSMPGEAGGTPPYDMGDDEGEMFGGAAEQAHPPAAPQVEYPPAPARLMVVFPLPQESKPLNAARKASGPPRKAVNRPPAPSGPPANAVYATESRPIPQAVQAIVDEIRARTARKSNKAGFPQRVDLRNMPSGMMDLDRRYGYITRGSELMGFYGDLRLFDEATWKYLVSSGKGD